MVVGETSRAMNWSLYGYERETNPELCDIEGLTAFSHVLTESNTTHKSVPMLISSVSAHDFGQILRQKSIITAFKEGGFSTAFFSNQRYNHSFIDFFGMEADTYDFIKEDVADSKYNPSDDELLKLVEQDISFMFHSCFGRQSAIGKTTLPYRKLRHRTAGRIFLPVPPSSTP